MNPPPVAELSSMPLCVRNRLMYPNNEPVTGDRVKFVMIVRQGWRQHPSEGRVMGVSYAWTDGEGVWTTRLLPYTAFDEGLQPFVFVQVYEQGSYVGAARVEPPRYLGDTRWLRELLVEQPPPEPSGWRPINRLHQLADVDPSAATAPEGSVLVRRGGTWVPEMPDFGARRLSQLSDVDEDTTLAPTALDTLQYISSAKGWGVIKSYGDKPVPVISLPEGSDGYTVRLSWSERDPESVTEYRWGDEVSAEEWAIWPDDGTEYLDHTYSSAGRFYLAVRYYGGEAGSQPIDIPYGGA